MEIKELHGPITEGTTDLLAFALFEGSISSNRLIATLDQRLGGHLSQIVGEEHFDGKADQSLVIHTHGAIDAARILFVGLGKRDDFDISATRRYGAIVVQEAQRRGCKQLRVVIPPLDRSVKERTLQLCAEGLTLGDYSFERYLSKAKQKPKSVELISIAYDDDDAMPPVEKHSLSISRAEIVAGAICFARDLVNEPGSSLPPRKLAEIAKQIADEHQLECKIWNKKECEKNRMNLLLAVAAGSVEEPRFIHLTYKPRGKEPSNFRFVLVGKGVTFDSGGLSLKPSEGMLDMKTDMAGAAVVLGIMRAIPQLGLPIEVHGIIPSTENMISGSAYKLGDVIVGHGEKSVEITNTDAEGRLALADALAYAVKLNPTEMMDIATLTGACMVALGPQTAGLMGNNLALIERYLAASRRAGEEVWHLPMPSKLKEQLKSPIADLKNSGDRMGGALTAAIFLKEFVENVPWIHLDIAGPARAAKADAHILQGGTGYGIAAILEYLSTRTNEV